MIQQPDRMAEYTSSGTVAEVVQYEDAPDECLIFPNSCTSPDEATVWVVAQEGSFISLDDVR